MQVIGASHTRHKKELQRLGQHLCPGHVQATRVRGAVLLPSGQLVAGLLQVAPSSYQSTLIMLTG